MCWFHARSGIPAHFRLRPVPERSSAPRLFSFFLRYPRPYQCSSLTSTPLPSRTLSIALGSSSPSVQLAVRLRPCRENCCLRPCPAAFMMPSPVPALFAHSL
eukprot:639038-Pleurochrysis_carterae.AAC.1